MDNQALVACLISEKDPVLKKALTYLKKRYFSAFERKVKGTKLYEREKTLMDLWFESIYSLREKAKAGRFQGANANVGGYFSRILQTTLDKALNRGNRVAEMADATLPQEPLIVAELEEEDDMKLALYRQLRRCREKLSVAQKRVLDCLARYPDDSWEQLAEHLEEKSVNIRNVYSRALKTLKHCMTLA